ncbi:hypothetical protein HDE_10423 [Halotydeus destructor]|nr:hypothetical protein HDE_10423 [Halotydeus destructor]
MFGQSPLRSRPKKRMRLSSTDRAKRSERKRIEFDMADSSRDTSVALNSSEGPKPSCSKDSGDGSPESPTRKKHFSTPSTLTSSVRHITQSIVSKTVTRPDSNVDDEIDLEDEGLITDDDSDDEENVIEVPDEITSDFYKMFIKKATEGHFLTISDFKKLNKSLNNKGIYGVVRMVTVAEQSRLVTINDPTEDSGITIKLPLINEIQTGNIIRLRSLKRHPNQRYYEFEGDLKDSSSYHEVVAFMCDYEEDEAVKKFAPQNFKERTDQPVANVLEIWTSSAILKNSLSSLNTNTPSYVDIVFQGLAANIMIQSLALTVWDGTTPTAAIVDPYKAEYGEEGKGFDSKMNRAFYPYAIGKYAHINIWKNESGKQNVHHQMVSNLSMCNNKDLILFFNLEVKPTSDGKLALTMRSGRHRGKCVRYVSRKSVLGKMLMDNIKRAVAGVTARLRLQPDDSFTEEEMSAATVDGEHLRSRTDSVSTAPSSISAKIGDAMQNGDDSNDSVSVIAKEESSPDNAAEDEGSETISEPVEELESSASTVEIIQTFKTVKTTSTINQSGDIINIEDSQDEETEIYSTAIESPRQHSHLDDTNDIDVTYEGSTQALAKDISFSVLSHMKISPGKKRERVLEATPKMKVHNSPKRVIDELDLIESTSRIKSILKRPKSPKTTTISIVLTEEDEKRILNMPPNISVRCLLHMKLEQLEDLRRIYYLEDRERSQNLWGQSNRSDVLEVISLVITAVKNNAADVLISFLNKREKALS